MSTRANIHIIQISEHAEDDFVDSVQLYRHSDGYPESDDAGVIPSVRRAWEMTNGGLGFRACRCGYVAGFLCAASFELGDIDCESYVAFEPESGLLPHGDIAYFYNLMVGKGNDAESQAYWKLEAFKINWNHDDDDSTRELVGVWEFGSNCNGVKVQ